MVSLVCVALAALLFFARHPVMARWGYDLTSYATFFGIAAAISAVVYFATKCL